MIVSHCKGNQSLLYCWQSLSKHSLGVLVKRGEKKETIRNTRIFLANSGHFVCQPSYATHHMPTNLVRCKRFFYRFQFLLPFFMHVFIFQKTRLSFKTVTFPIQLNTQNVHAELNWFDREKIVFSTMFVRLFVWQWTIHTFKKYNLRQAISRVYY